MQAAQTGKIVKVNSWRKICWVLNRNSGRDVCQQGQSCASKTNKKQTSKHFFHCVRRWNHRSLRGNLLVLDRRWIDAESKENTLGSVDFLGGWHFPLPPSSSHFPVKSLPKGQNPQMALGGLSQGTNLGFQPFSTALAQLLSCIGKKIICFFFNFQK